MKRIVPALAMGLLMLAASAVAQLPASKSEMPYSGAPCTAVGGIGPSPRQVALFNRFDKALRAALMKNDVASLSFLVHFPLRVNTSKGTVLIPDAESLNGHYTDIFPPSVRDAVLGTTAPEYTCRYDEGLAYKADVLWASTDGHKFAVDVINVSSRAQRPTTPALVYSCETKTQRIAIYELPDGDARYRSWKKPKLTGGPPDVDLAHGKKTFEGSGICGSPLYTFKSGNAMYKVQAALGCTDGSEPKQATGHLSVSIDDKPVSNVWCF